MLLDNHQRSRGRAREHSLVYSPRARTYYVHASTKLPTHPSTDAFMAVFAPRCLPLSSYQ
ncbi:hypothetical protein VTO73DRAFT_6691, partial [Trametes versicolor]